MFGKSSMASVEMTSSKVLSIYSLLSYEQWSVNSRSVFSLQKILVCILLGTFLVSFSRKGTGECVTVPCRVCMNITYYHVLKPSWCHCHTLSLASVKYRLVLPFWYRLTWVVRDKGPLNGCVCAAHYKIFLIFRATHQSAVGCSRFRWSHVCNFRPANLGSVHIVVARLLIALSLSFVWFLPNRINSVLHWLVCLRRDMSRG